MECCCEEKQKIDSVDRDRLRDTLSNSVNDNNSLKQAAEFGSPFGYGPGAAGPYGGYGPFYGYGPRNQNGPGNGNGDVNIYSYEGHGRRRHHRHSRSRSRSNSSDDRSGRHR